MKRAIFLDKDGTLVEDVPYNCDVRLIRLMPRLSEGLRRLQAAGYLLVIVSNQAGVAHGKVSLEALASAEATIRALLRDLQIRLDGFYFCPHHPEGRVPVYARSCDCRKPAPGLLRKAGLDGGIDLSASWMIGDILHDVEAGRRAGCRTILLDNGHETEWLLGAHRVPHHMATDLDSAADIVLAEDQGARMPTTEEGRVPDAARHDDRDGVRYAG